MKSPIVTQSLHSRANRLLSDLQDTPGAGRKDHLPFGIELQNLEGELRRRWKDTRFPTFAPHPTPDSAVRARRRRDMVSLVMTLPPLDLEILEWLGDKKDTETAFLYAYSRGNTARPDDSQRKLFFRRVQEIADANPDLMDVEEVGRILRLARTAYATVQASAFENLN